MYNVNMKPSEKKIIILLSIAAVVLLMMTITLALVSNSSSVVNQNEPRPLDPNNPVEISYWGLWEADEVMHPMIEKYEALNPGITINYSRQAFTGYEEKAYTRLEQTTLTGEPAPDIVRIHNSWLPKYQKYLTAIPNTVMTPEEYAQEFYPTALDDFTGTDGGIYAIPLHIDGLLVIYNKKMLRDSGYLEPAKDWDSFMEMARVMTKRDSSGKIVKSGLAIGTSKNVMHSMDILSYFLLQNKVQVMNDTRDQVNLNNARAISAFETYASFVKDDDATWATYLPSDLTKFQNGELAMMFGTTDRALDILEQAPNIDFGLAQLPRLPNNEETYYSSYWADSVTIYSQNSEHAWRFVKWLSEPEQQRRLFQNAEKVRPFGPPYARVSMKQEVIENIYTQPIAVMAPFMKSWQMGERGQVETLVNSAITEMVERDQDAEDIVMKLEKDINNIISVSNIVE